MSESRNIGNWGALGSQVREDLFGPYYRGRYGAFNQFLVDGQCVLFGALQGTATAAGQSPLANAYGFLRGFNGCYAGPPPSYTKELPEPALIGGQCPGVRYDAVITVQIDGGAPQARGNSTRGPVTSIAIEDISTGTNRQGVIMRGFDSNGNPDVVQMISGLDNQELTNLQIVSFERDDGLPDDCGNGPQGTPQYVPDPEPFPPYNDGDVILPGRDIDVMVDTPGGIVPVVVEIGDATLCFGGSVCVSIDGIPHRLNPDGGIEVFSDSVGEPSDTATDSEVLEEVKEAICQEIEGDVQWVGCDGETLTSSFSGTGIQGIQAQIATTHVVSNAGSNEFCPLLIPDEFQNIELGSSSISSSEVDSFIDVALNVETIRVSIDIEGSSNPYAVRRGSSGGNDNEQSRFGVISFVYEVNGNDNVAWTRNQYYSRGIYDVEVVNVNTRKIRVSLKSGSTAIVREFK